MKLYFLLIHCLSAQNSPNEVKVTWIDLEKTAKPKTRIELVCSKRKWMEHMAKKQGQSYSCCSKLL